MAKEMTGMTGVMQDKITEVITADPTQDVDQAIEAAKSGGNTTQMIISLGPRQKAALSKFATDEGTNSGEAAVDLIMQGLETKGYLNDIAQ